jgi:hypothetical protein
MIEIVPPPTPIAPHPAADNFYRVQFLRHWEEWVKGTASQVLASTGADLERNLSEMTVAYSVLMTLRSEIGMAPLIAPPRENQNER